jgi:tetratricopeptide (TPR) repeat protein
MAYDTPPLLDAAAHTRAAIAASQADDRGRAIAHLRVALAIAPQVPESWANLALALQRAGRLDDAERTARQSVALNPALAAGWNALGLVAIDRGRQEEATEHLERALQIDPRFAIAHMNLGIAQQARGRDEDAFASLERALALDPSLASAHYNIGALHHKRGRTDEAVERYYQALHLRPDDAQSHFNLALAHLIAGRMEEGWREYGWRRERREHARLLRSERHNRIVIHSEQGLGDNLFFLRFAPALRARGMTLDFVGDSRLHPMLARTGLFASVASRIDEVDATGRDVALAGDLPSLAGIAKAPPLPLGVDDARLAAMRDRLAALGDAPRIALAWRAGEPKSGRIENLFKEIPLDALGSALRGVRATWIAIQRDPMPGEIESLSKAIGAPVHDFAAVNTDLDDALALLAVVDDYVGVSSTLVHLRAGLGGTARVLVPFPPEWRWMESGDASPWFPRAKVYRRKVGGDWTATLARLTRDLKARR